MKMLARNAGALALVLVLALFATMALKGPNGVPALVAKRKEIQALQDQNASLAAENERKRIRIEKLKNRRSEQELEIRDKLKKLKAGEVQYITPELPAATVRPAE